MEKLTKRAPSPAFFKYARAALFFLFSFLLPTQLGKHFFPPFAFVSGVRIDYLAPTLYLTDIAAFALILVHLHLFPPLFKKKNLIAFLVLCLIGNWLVALSKPLFFYRLLKIAEAAAVFYVFANSYSAYRKYIIAGLAIATFIQLPLALAQLSLGHSLQGVWYFLGERLISLATPGIAKASLDGRELLRPYGTFSHPNSMAGFFLLVELLFLSDRKITNTILRNAVILFSSLLVFVSFSKNAILVYLALNLFYIVKTKNCRICIIAASLTSLTAAALFLTANTDAQSFAKRFTLINQSLSIISRYPFGGVGLGNYLLAQAAFPVRYAYFFLQPVHNVFLLFAAEAGLPAFVLAAAGLILSLRRRHGYTYLLLITAVIVTGMSDHYWLTLEQNFLLGASLLGAFLYNNVHGTKKTVGGNR